MFEFSSFKFCLKVFVKLSQFALSVHSYSGAGIFMAEAEIVREIGA